MFTEREIEEMAPLVGEYGYYGDYVYPEDFRSGSDEYLDEQWMPIDDNPAYWVSTHGRVWSSKSQSFIKPKRLDRHGHLGVSLYNTKHDVKYRYLHRLMAKAFIDNRENHPVVRHLDDEVDNNYIDNLAWGTQKDNMRDCISNGHFYYPTDEDRYKGNKDRLVPVIVTNMFTGEKKKYESLNDAVRATGVQQSNAWKVMHGRRKHTGGYIFERCSGDE